MKSTSIIDSYQISSSGQDILKILQQVEEQKSSLMWQNYLTHRTIFNIQKVEVSEINQELRVLFNGHDKKIDANFPVYIKMALRDLIFKGEVTDKDNEGVLLKLPSEIRMREFREHVRTQFHFGEKFVIAQPLAKDLHCERKPQFKVHLVDISQIGLGLYITDANLHLFRRGEVLQFLEIDSVKLKAPLLGEVAYIKKEEHPTMRRVYLYRVGIKLKKELSAEILAKLLP
jgi:hypothetical protein